MAEYAGLTIWTDAYLGDTRHLSTLEHGAYLLLLMCAWRTPENGLPNDDIKLARMCGLPLNIWRRIRTVILAFWEVGEDGLLHQKRLDIERNFQRRRSEKQSINSQARWLKTNETIHAMGMPNGIPNASQVDAPALALASRKKKEAPIDIVPVSTLRPIPKDWHPDAAIEQFAALKCILSPELAEQAEQFRDHYLANGRTAADWNARFRLWLNRRHQFCRPSKSNGNGATRHDFIGKALDEFNAWCDRDQGGNPADRQRNPDRLPAPKRR